LNEQWWQLQKEGKKGLNQEHKEEDEVKEGVEGISNTEAEGGHITTEIQIIYKIISIKTEMKGEVSGSKIFTEGTERENLTII
jgi:hypothetical protein